MILSFRDKDVEAVFEGRSAPRLAAIRRQLERRLQYLDAAVTVDDLRSPTSNRFEWLKGDRAGQCSIRVNAQWRLCFRWTDQGPEQVELVDYH